MKEIIVYEAEKRDWSASKMVEKVLTEWAENALSQDTGGIES